MLVRRISVMLCVLWLTIPIGHVTAETLDSLIQVAIESNPDILAAKHELTSSEYLASSAGALPDPQLTFGAMSLPRSSFSFGETPMTGFVIGLSQTIPWPGKLSAGSELAGLTADKQRLGVSSLANTIARLVAQTYYDYSYWTTSDEVLRQNQALIEAMIASAATRYANGLGSGQDVLRAKTARARIENRRLRVAEKRRSALLRLGWLTANPATVESSLPASLPGPEGVTQSNFDSAGVFTNPQLVAAGLEVSASNKRLDLSRAGYWPDITFGFDYNIRKYTTMDPVAGEDFLSARIGLRIPLWFLSKQKNQVSSAHEKVLAAEARKQSLARELDRQLADARLNLERIAQSLKLYENEVIPQAAAAREAARVAYDVGQVDFNGLLAAHLEQLEVEIERLDLLKQYHQEQAVLAELTNTINGR